MNQRSQNSFDVVLKIAERCNLACSYCYYFYHEFDNSKSPPIIKRDVVDRLPSFLLQAARETNISRFTIVLHGGEPLLVKKAYFDEICTKLRGEIEPEVEVAFAIQTNGVLIDDEWIELFAKHGVRAGVSIDGSPEEHDLRRPDKKGRGSYERSVAGLRKLQAAVAAGRIKGAGVLAVIPEELDAEGFLRHIVHDLKVRSPTLNMPRGGWDSDDAVRWNKNIDARRALVNTWMQDYTHPRFTFIRDFAQPYVALGSDVGAEKADIMNSRRHHIVTISSAGEIMVDDNLLALDAELSHGAPTIFDTTLVEFLNSATWQELNEAIDTVPEPCGECVWYRTCRSGNLYNRFSKEDRFAPHSVLCESIKAMHEEMADFLVAKRLTTAKKLVARLEAPPTTSAKREFAQLMGAETV
jgi:uncharacterized protein